MFQSPNAHLHEGDAIVLRWKSLMEEETKQQLISWEKCYRFSTVYGLLKYPKEGTPLRQMVNSKGLTLQSLSRYIAEQLQPYAEGVDLSSEVLKSVNRVNELRRNLTRRLICEFRCDKIFLSG